MKFRISLRRWSISIFCLAEYGSVLGSAETLPRIVRQANLLIERFLGEVRGDVVEPEARRFTERIAVALQASLLVRFSPAAITDGFLASRLDATGTRFRNTSASRGCSFGD
jgi:putative acyl-CoA dehydrogenase